MIPKRIILQRAKAQGLRDTIVEKDYALGWVLLAVEANDYLSQWIFKGGTCLKKCFFDTYRFSEDLDFTVPNQTDLSAERVHAALIQVAEWIEARTGLRFPRGGIEVEQYENPRGNTSYQAKLTYVGPLKMQRASRQRIKFDITSDEIVVSEPDLRRVHHPYEDDPGDACGVRTYSLEEITAEKVRALFERGRARDLYDVVHLHRMFADELDVAEARRCVAEKFAFKGLGTPSLAKVMSAFDQELLKANWKSQLSRQLPDLPPPDGFIDELPEALRWIEPMASQPSRLVSVEGRGTILAPPRFPSASVHTPSGQQLETIRFAARNRICAFITYHGSQRLVEPYSLRRPHTGNLLLFVYERLRRGSATGSVKAYKVQEIEAVMVSSILFRPRWRIEL